MDGQEAVHCLDLNNQLVGKENIESKAAIQMYAFVYDGNCDLPLKFYVPEGQFVAETFLVSRLQKSCPKGGMNFHGDADDLFCHQV